MQHTFILLLCLLFSGYAISGQTPDTTFVTTTSESGVMEQQQFPDRYDFVFGTKQPTRFLLKWNALPVLLPLGYERIMEENYYVFSSYILERPRFELEAEVKISKALSIQTAASFQFTKNGAFGGRQRITEWRAEPRWYFNMPKRIKAGKAASNLSGNYFGLEYQNIRFRQPGLLVPNFENESEAVTLRFGLQRRLFQYGYFDASAGFGHRTDVQTYLANGNVPTTIRDERFFLNTRVAMSLAFGGPGSTDKSTHSYCDVFRCFQEDRRLIKIDLLKLLRLEGSLFVLNPQLSYEAKIGASPFSVETTVQGLWLAYRPTENNAHFLSREYSVALSVEPRYYFLQKGRIAKGKSGNNLSGVYAGINAGLEWIRQPNSYFVKEKLFLGSNEFHDTPLVGFQHRIFRNGFVNYKFGIICAGLEPRGFLSELRMGLAF